MDDSFVKADSNNLPKIDSQMVASFFHRNPDFFSSEVKHVKTMKRCFPQRRWVLLVGSCLGVCLGLILLWIYLSVAFMGSGEETLLPPDPEVRLPPSTSRLREYSKAAVCSDGPPCSKIGKEILSEGGSAVDAAIGALFCNGLVNGQSMGLGGGFVMTVFAGGRAESLIARETAPTGASSSLYRKDHLLSRNGGLAVGVPGELRGYSEAWKKYGRLPWARLVEPTVRLCREGYRLSRPQYDGLHFRPTISDDPTFRDMFVNPDTNKLYPEGSLIKPKKLCDTLSTIMLEGGNAIHNGSLTNFLVEDINALGGLVTKEDLNNYKADWAEPVAIKLSSGDTVLSAPAPASGPLLLYILSILDGYNFTRSQPGSQGGEANTAAEESLEEQVLTAHRAVEAFKFAFARRTELADPRFVNVSELIRNLTSKRYAEETRLRINDSQTYSDPKHYGAVYFSREDHGTAHISVLSNDGEAVSVTSTVNLYFGAGVTSPSTGIVLNSVMDDFSIPGIVNYFSLPPSPNNLIEPGKRPLSSSCPTIVLDPEGQVKLAIGASGGTKITTSVAWVIMRNLWFNEDVKEAVDFRRIHHQLTPMELTYEYGVLKQVIDGLKKLGHKTSRYRERGSIICAVSRKDGKIFGNADFRKGGDVDGIN